VKQTQTDRLIAYLRSHPGSSSLELTLALGIVNTTGRISDARKEGHVVSCVRDKAGVARYSVVEPTVQLGLGIAS
jgi:hypothetical protein